jgi:hypothetical protein
MQNQAQSDQGFRLNLRLKSSKIKQKSSKAKPSPDEVFAQTHASDQGQSSNTIATEIANIKQNQNEVLTSTHAPANSRIRTRKTIAKTTIANIAKRQKGETTHRRPR